MSRRVRHDWFLSRVYPGRRQATNRRATASSFPFHRRLRIEPLEDRRLLAVVTVDTLDDTVDFGDSVTSLREAIFATNLVGGADTIEFAAALTTGGPATLTLTQGELAITDSLAINAPGASLLTIRSFDPTPNSKTGDGSRIFNIDDGNSGNLLDVSISGLTLTGGDVTGTGGAISARENLIVAQSIITGNSTSSPPVLGGGGIYSGAGYTSPLPSSLTVIDCSITNNAAKYSEGGGIRKRSGSLVVVGCTFSGNTARLGGGVSAADERVEVQIFGSTFSGNSATGGTFGGGAIFISNGNSTLADSTLSGNSAPRGGGLYLDINSQAAVTGSTISDNSTGGSGGGIFGSNLTVSDSTISNNTAGGEGGGIRAFNLTATNSTFSGNSALGDGGGIRASNLTVTDSTISGNTAGGNGGGSWSGNLTVISSTISGNSAAEGGGIRSSNFTVVSSTISGNTAGGNGGGIRKIGGTMLMVYGSTISGNSAGLDGGGIFGDDLTVTGSTISGNTADADANGTGRGGGISGIGQISHTIVAGSLLGNGSQDEMFGTFASTFSLIGVDTGATIADNGGNLMGTAAMPIDSLLGPLSDNGGPTFTHALLAGSPAINMGDLNAVAGVDSVPEFDQRGTPFGRVFNGRIDIGAFEYQAASDLNLVVDTLADEADGDYALGDLSLRDALLLANTYPSIDTIRFDPALSGGTILLTMGELAITDNTTIEGLGANLLTIDASGNDPTPDSTLQDGDDTNDADGSRVFNIDDGNDANLLDVSISGLTLTGGDVGGFGVASNGGAIVSRDNLTITASTISGNNSARGNGGGIHAWVGNVTVTSSTISGNSARGTHFPYGGGYGGNGGGISSAYGNVTVTSSTISGNSALGGGGGIAAGGAVTVISSTISGNSALGGGGGISGGNVTVTGSTISGNSAGGGGGIRGGSVTVTGSTIEGNTASDRGGGVSGGNVTVTGSTISGNSAGGGGGGIFAFANVTVISSTISGNSAGRGGGISGYGNVTVTSSTISGNSAGHHGGGIWSFSSNVTVTSSTISGNSAGQHGGGVSGGNVTVTGSTIEGNTASVRGGGVSGGNVTVTGSTISGNSAGHHGGGVWKSASGSLAVTSSTISGNSAVDGGGLFSEGNATLSHSTIAFNTTTGIGKGVFVNSGSLSLDHSIVAQNTGTNGDVNGLLGTTISAQFSLIGNNQGSGLTAAPVGAPDVNGNLIGTSFFPINPQFGPLADNGGPTMTHALLLGSPALDGGNPAAEAGENDVPLFDQRGAPFDRVRGAAIDIGAYEVQPAVLIGDYNEDDKVDAADYTVWRDILTAGGSVLPNDLTPGVVNEEDYLDWRAQFGRVAGADSGAAATIFSAADRVGKPIVQLPAKATLEPAETDAATAREASFAMFETRSLWHDSGSRSRGRIHRYQVADSGGDDLLLVAVDRVWRSPRQDSFANDDSGNGEHCVDDDESESEIDEPLAEALAARRGALSNYISPG